GQDVLGGGQVALGQGGVDLVLALEQHRQALVPVALDQAQVLAHLNVGVGVVGVLVQEVHVLGHAAKFLPGVLQFLGPFFDLGKELHHFRLGGGFLGGLDQAIADLVVVIGNGLFEQTQGQFGDDLVVFLGSGLGGGQFDHVGLHGQGIDGVVPGDLVDGGQ